MGDGEPREASSETRPMVLDYARPVRPRAISRWAAGVWLTILFMVVTSCALGTHTQARAVLWSAPAWLRFVLLFPASIVLALLDWLSLPPSRFLGLLKTLLGIGNCALWGFGLAHLLCRPKRHTTRASQ